MSTSLKTNHPLAGQAVTIQRGLLAGKEYRVENYWETVTGKSWMDSDGNPAALQYAIRSRLEGLPLDDDVLYGKIGVLGYLVHVSEIEAQGEPA